MTILFTGGGRASGLFSSLPPQDTYRVAWVKEVWKEDDISVDIYKWDKEATSVVAGKKQGAAVYVGAGTSAKSLVDLWI